MGKCGVGCELLIHLSPHSFRQIHPPQQILKARVGTQIVKGRVGGDKRQNRIAFGLGFFECRERSVTHSERVVKQS